MVEEGVLSPTSVQHISKTKVLFDTTKLYRIECTVNLLNNLAAHKLGETQQQSAASIKIWVPSSIMECILPDMVAAYVKHTKAAKKVTVQPYSHPVCFILVYTGGIISKQNSGPSPHANHSN